MTTSREQFRQALADIVAAAKARLPECNGRVESAAALVLHDEVVLGDGHTARVGSATDPAKTYEIRPGYCSCQDFARAPQGLCKHRMAMMMLLRVQELLPTTTSVPAEATAADTMALPEAPASVNVHLTISGRQVQLTLRGTDETRLLARLATVLEQYPVETKPEAGSAKPEGWCAVHQVQMQHHTNAKGQWYSHYLGDGKHCKGK